MMNHYEFQWNTVDGIQLCARGWEPEAPPAAARAVVCLVHGLGEHCGRYGHLAAALVEAGYAVLAFDLRGHGKSEGKRGHSPSFKAFMDDIACLLEEASIRYPGLPRFLYGHSLGGLLVLNFVLRHKPKLAGVIATGPGLRTPLTEQTLKVSLAKGIGQLLPTLSLHTGLDYRLISRDPAVVDAYAADPLVHERSTLRMAKTTLQSIPWVFEHACEFDVPLLLMHGTGDRLVYPEGSREFAGQVGGQIGCDCTLKLWEGLYHEIHNEPEKEEVFAFLLEWLGSKT
jgi:alpha-beta hydrolase superfamily lysophospholipase